ncbi:hypothetical protein BGZ67_001302 [Mortierella alpina]|nr:hypothetical protein BGZ67_001302 [Mortierella alpina]
MPAQKTPLAIPEILLHVSQYLDLQDCISASQVSHLWHKTFTSALPSGTVLWKDTLPEADRAAALEQLYNNNVQTLEAHFRYWVGKALYYMRDRDAQKRAWEPFKQALILAAEEEQPAADKATLGHQDNNQQRRPLQLQKLLIRGGISPEEDYLPILLKIKTLRHLHIDATPGREFRIDISRLFKYLGLPSLQTLRQLTVKHMWWPNMGFPYPNSVRCQLAKLVLEGTDMPEQNLSRLLETCPLLEELVAIDTLPRWNPHMFKNLSTLNPLLQALTFSIKPSSAGEECTDAQVDILINAMTLDLKALGLYRLNCSPSTFERLQAHFPNLTRFEIHGKSSPACGPMVHKMLCTSPQLLRLKAKDVFIPMALLRDQEGDDGTPLLSWVCSNLRTLEVSFGDHFEAEDGASRVQEDEGKVRAETKILFGYLVRHVAQLERLTIHKHGLSLRRGDGIELVKEGLTRLKRLCIISESLPQAEEGGEVAVSDQADVDEDELEGLKAQLKRLSLRATAVDPPMYGPPLKDPRQRHPDGYYVR